jgi:hypothetical protein
VFINELRIKDKMLLEPEKMGNLQIEEIGIQK